MLNWLTNNWLILVLVAGGVFLLVEIGLVLAGKKDLAKKLLIPVTVIFGALVVVLKLPGSSDIKAERDRIEEARKRLMQERDELRQKLDEATKEHEKKVAALQDKIKQSDVRAATLEDRIKTMTTQGVEEWVKSLSDQQRKKILQGELPPGLPDDL